MNFEKLIVIIVSLYCIFALVLQPVHAAIIGQCQGVRLGKSCLRDQDCYALNAVCGGNHKCKCGAGFQAVDAFNNLTIPMKCKAAPSQYGRDCVSTCTPPLICGKNGECGCERPATENSNGKCSVNCPPGQKLIGTKCQRSAGLGQNCRVAKDCEVPFSTCVRGKCNCGLNSRPNGPFCTPTCPDGNAAVRTCRTQFEHRGSLLEVLDKTDSCRQGEQCITFGNPPVGLCCPVRCPYGNAETRYSCEPSAKDKCPKSSHFCYDIRGPGMRNNLCCPRPCREPYPILVRGECMNKAFRGDPCLVDEQCDFGVSMQCSSKGRCECRRGFESNSRSKFPTCKKTCLKGENPVGDRCEKEKGADSPCTSDRMCSGVFICANSVCSCPCGYVSRNGNCLREEWARLLPTDISGVPKFIENALG